MGAKREGANERSGMHRWGMAKAEPEGREGGLGNFGAQVFVGCPQAVERPCPVLCERVCCQLAKKWHAHAHAHVVLTPRNLGATPHRKPCQQSTFGYVRTCSENSGGGKRRDFLFPAAALSLAASLAVPRSTRSRCRRLGTARTARSTLASRLRAITRVESTPPRRAPTAQVAAAAASPRRSQLAPAAPTRRAASLRRVARRRGPAPPTA